jgi:predicted transposase/invertase (TIGR01784 family)
MKNDELLKELYETARLKKLTKKEMETYQQSVLDYSVVRNALSYEREKSEKRGIKKGLKQGEERGIKKGIEQGIEQERIRFAKLFYKQNMSIEQITELTGFTKEQISDILAKE